jgi:hypothetical protein
MSISLNDKTSPVVGAVRNAMGDKGYITYPQDKVSVTQQFDQVLHIAEIDQHLLVNRDGSLIVPVKGLLANVVAKVEEFRLRANSLCFQKQSGGTSSQASASTTASGSLETSGSDSASSSGSIVTVPGVLTIEQKATQLRQEIEEIKALIQRVSSEGNAPGLLCVFRKKKHDLMSISQRFMGNATSTERECTSKLIREFNDRDTAMSYIQGRLHQNNL